MPLRLLRSLRGRVLASTIMLVAVGLIVAGSATYGFLNAFLVRRVDQPLWSAVFPVADALNETDRFDPDGHGPPRGGFLVPPGTYGLLLDADGRMIRAEPFGFEEQQAAVPDLPSGLPGSTSAPDAEPRLLTVSTSEGSSIRYRAIAAPLAEGGTLVVAIPMIEVTDTLRRLLTVEIAVSVAVVAVIGGMALWLVRIGLRPLQRMGETAGAIAAGDLSRRVTPAEPDTEVGRLGLALNSMLGQIEEAFAERTASEQRFRRVVADASHGLRTPLTSIRGYAELFRRGASGRPEDLSKSMERIEAEAARMGVLVEDLFAPRPAGPGTATGSRPGRSDDPGRSGGPGCPGRRPWQADRASGGWTGDRRR
jgi:two-component system OmpR family sensor kinase